MTGIKRLLIANRGEIACRVIRTAKSLGINTVAVYSDADSEALHTRAADQAVHIGASAVSESYLSIERIIQAARDTGCDAIHPGYGFLSENAAFATACGEAGLIFVGPSASAIELMGDKARAKRAMIEAGVPCIPGYQGEDQATETLAAEAKRIGFPVMIKAAAGGGGRGMRLVGDSSSLERAIETARSEALGAFGVDELILERALASPRHVEVQVFGDTLGNLVYLGERDCSVQRRHQKVIEEAPCPVMTEELRAAMGKAAVCAARAVDYVSAGTVEFLLDRDGAFYFLEMNTRLQVEHPVTELITGMDLVELQLKVAAGEPLGFGQEDVRLSGHAIEVRLYAEDPCNNFLPSTGKIKQWRSPAGDGVRVDAGIESGSEVSPYYDPMLAKVIAGGDTREEARQRLVKSLSESALVGPATNRDFLIDALNRETFAKGQATTAFIGEEYGEDGFELAPSVADFGMAAVAQYKLRTLSALSEALDVNSELLNWSSGVSLDAVSVYQTDDGSVSFNTRPTGAQTYAVRVGEVSLAEFTILDVGDRTMTLEYGRERRKVAYYAHEDGLTLTLATNRLQFTVKDRAAAESDSDARGSGRVVSPMHGQLIEIFVQPGDSVTKGQRLAVLEAMKMQHEISAPVDGTVKEVHAQRDAQVAWDALLIEIEP